MKEKLEAFLKAEGVYEKFVHNLAKHRMVSGLTLDKYVELATSRRFPYSHERLIGGAFLFPFTDEGIDFWQAISEKWVSFVRLKKLIFQKGSNTIRQMPENYLIAHFLDNSWRCEPDLAADKHLCMKVFEELLNFESKYNPNGDEIINKIEL